MSIIRISHNKENPYTIINTEALRAKISWGATGLLAYLLSFKDNWEFHMDEISKRKEESYHSTNKYFRELIASGYAIRYQRNILKNGRSSWSSMEYTVFEYHVPFEERMKNIIETHGKVYFPDKSEENAFTDTFGAEGTFAHTQVAHTLERELSNINPEVVSISKKKNIKKEIEISEEALRLLGYFNQSLAKNIPEVKEIPKNETAHQFDLLLKHYSAAQIQETINFAHRGFWSAHAHSPSYLRVKFARIARAMNLEKTGAKPKQTTNRDRVLDKFKNGQEYHGATVFIDDEKIGLQRGFEHKQVRFNENGFDSQLDGILRFFRSK